MGQFLGRNAERTRGDLKESFSIGPDSAVSIPTSAASAIPTLEAFRAACFAAGQRLLDLFTVALEIKDDRAYFRSRHTYGHNESLRLLHYPSFPKGAANDDAGQDGKTQWASLKVGSKDIRAGQHQDFGSNTLLFQSPPADDGSPTAVEGLELFVRRDDGPDVSPDGSGGKGWWIAAPKPEGVDEGGSMLVNVGVSMEAWSGGQFKATYHRVRRPSGAISALGPCMQLTRALSPSPTGHLPDAARSRAGHHPPRPAVCRRASLPCNSLRVVCAVFN